MTKNTKQKWQAEFRDSVGGILFVGARRNSRGPWIRKGHKLPRHVFFYLGLTEAPGKARNCYMEGYKTLAEFIAAVPEFKAKQVHEIDAPGAGFGCSPRELPKLPGHKGLDGSHCGLGDWYDDFEAQIRKALKKRGDAEWTTGWYASKHEIASANISSVDHKIKVEVSVSDDFDTNGMGDAECRWHRMPRTVDGMVEKVRTMIAKAWEGARENQKDNRCYCGFAVTDNESGSWVETYIAPVGCGHEMPQPPGDCYHKWGWQGDGKLPRRVKSAMKEWIDEVKDGSFTTGGYTIKPWDEKKED